MTNSPVPPGGPVGAQPELPVCARHSDRPTGLRCTRCDRPACPDCLREASVGYQCVDCVREGQRSVRRKVTIAGAELKRTVVVTPALVVVNVLVFIVTVFQAKSLNGNYAAQLSQDWSLYPPLVADGEWWRLVTSGFLHDGPAHLALNMLALWLLGRELEPVLGRLRYTGVYLVSLLGGSAAAYMFGQSCIPVVGASGAVFGLMGGLLAVLLRLKLSLSPVLTTIGLNVLISVVVPKISLLGHLGGLVIGGLLTAGMVYPPSKNRNAWQVSAVIAAVVLLAGVIVLRNGQLAGVDVFAVELSNGDIGCVERP
ncbi:rhomboid family intramembrane serine protease [Lentzea sp. NBRC 105346]|uniref:rhomboid family intramembrane serine protease n=1 Tax=Lentzea sp. NBRC 105346 TaxID=3032205 RepID=UPI0024A0B00E|nr:rhomboid family intramembrane serine protease [Lentzea sp. NBRC 105346]GLZ32671.1 rhomboid family intramembrane serine protease [Lentzea sp. NBRC 105346]